MNQILSTSNDYNSYNKNNLRKIIIFFCIAVIILAVGIISSKAYGMYKKKQDESNFAAPEIQIDKQDSNQISINAYCEDGISYIIYTWNNANQNKVVLNGSTTFQRIVSMPYNKDNILKVEVVSINNIKGEATKSFGMEVDEQNPTIDSLVATGSKLSITASDDSGIEYIEYQWEGEEANKVLAEEDNNKTFNLQINIQRGTHKLTIKVVDKYGNEEKLSRLVTGVNEPEILVLRYGNVIKIRATHDMGIKQISALINDKLYTFSDKDPDYVKDTTLQKEFPLEEGENLVKVIVHSYEKLSDDESDDSIMNYSYKTFVGTCTYTPGE